MHPIFRVVSIFGHERTLSSYGLLLAIAIVVGATISARGCIRAGFPRLDAIATVGLVSAASLLGAALLDGAIRAAHSGTLDGAQGLGLTFYGAPLAGTVAFVATCRVFEVSPLRMADAAIPGVPIAHALGRLGCFFAGCCYGSESHGPLAVTFAEEGVPRASLVLPRHPVQLYEAFALLVLGGFFVLVPPKRIGEGHRALAYVVLYALVRLVTERFRGDGSRGVVAFGLSTSDVIALGSLAAVAAFLGFRRMARTV